MFIIEKLTLTWFHNCKENRFLHRMPHIVTSAS